MSGASAAAIRVRVVSPTDIAQLVDLCLEHAAYERTQIAAPDAERLREALFASLPSLYAWVAVDSADRLCGYATATVDFSTWNARDFVHLDCLFVREAVRGHGVGRRLVDAVFEHAAALGIAEVQWQTPDWNADAQRFYERLGASSALKVRYKRTIGDCPHFLQGRGRPSRDCGCDYGDGSTRVPT